MHSSFRNLNTDPSEKRTIACRSASTRIVLDCHNWLLSMILKRISHHVALWAFIGLATVLVAQQGRGTGNPNIVRKVQQVLSKLGYQPGSADGAMGTKTVDALKKFQNDKHLVPSGVIDDRTLDLLGIKEADSLGPEAELGMVFDPGGSIVLSLPIGNSPAGATPETIQGKVQVAMSLPGQTGDMRSLGLSQSLFLLSGTRRYLIEQAEGMVQPASWGPPPTAHVKICEGNNVICGKYSIRGTVSARPSNAKPGKMLATEIVELEQ